MKATNGQSHTTQTTTTNKNKSQPRPQKWNHPSLNSHEVRRVAVTAVCDPRCVVKYLWGLPQPTLMRERVAVALRACNHADLIGTPDERAEASANRVRVAQSTTLAVAPAVASPIAKAVAR